MNLDNFGDDQNRSSKLLGSLVVIICIVVGGYLINTVQRLYVNVTFTFSPLSMFYLQVIGGLILNIGAAANAPVLFFFW